ncbi:hypothetical protein Asppvi_010306 [Aspergillus pseudoviridinutans]|uniref:Uncharacterized protein n=1 Tax=Aspergillus pseudoviridinutans TaxID=1517512 RepID=A0A9P3BPC4_9EURO|nr:uncharacterized protein Asppvi_010306 [Aspergillus pseudoviridinutans]GIJ91341.1 hypothetical protein Asppvi_010306 [Aspergillus pseudoviridinutans]
MPLQLSMKLAPLSSPLSSPRVRRRSHAFCFNPQSKTRYDPETVDGLRAAFKDPTASAETGKGKREHGDQQYRLLQQRTKRGQLPTPRTSLQ